MQEGFVTVNKVPTRVLCWGGWLTSNDHKELVLCVPGNPGVTGYYKLFLETIHTNLGLPVWVLSHAGHEFPQDETQASSDNSQVYGVEEQVQHKIAFIEKYVPADVKVYLIGHSIGCKLILEALKNSSVRPKVKKSYLLFPTIERMATSPNGKFLTSLILPVVPVIVFLSWIFALLPRTVGKGLLHAYFAIRRSKDDAIDATMDLICPPVLRNVFHFAADEMTKVVDLDCETLMSNSDILFLYYGATDGWTPLNYCKEMKKSCPKVKSVVCKDNFEHAFVLSCGKEVGDMVSDWIKIERTK
ncbi:lipid droplet-associated hydrolase [Bacillus rossius redtenbacheri]|uniref:lipid droplet-associated hydrolase n=1 Tax=Bacillus rossius redtenbacheri TaxID=93214 RepID=UPI002FDCC7AB